MTYKAGESIAFYKTQPGRPDVVGLEFKGFRDVVWCGLANEPEFLTYGKDENGDDVCICGACDGNFEVETHEFLLHIRKP